MTRRKVVDEDGRVYVEKNRGGCLKAIGLFIVVFIAYSILTSGNQETKSSTNKRNNDQIEQVVVEANKPNQSNEEKATANSIKVNDELFIIENGYFQDGQLIIEFTYENQDDEPHQPFAAYTLGFKVTQEDDNAIYDLDADHFANVDNGREKISIGNPDIKPGGKIELYISYDLELEDSPAKLSGTWITDGKPEFIFEQ